MSEAEKQEFYQKILDRANSGNYFSSYAGLIYDTLDENCAEGHFRAEQCQCNPYKIVHGGVYYTLMDQMAGMVVAANGWVGVTISSSVNYIRSARLGETVCCRADNVHLGRSVAVVDAKCFDETGRLECTGTFQLFIRGKLDGTLRLR